MVVLRDTLVMTTSHLLLNLEIVVQMPFYLDFISISSLFISISFICTVKCELYVLFNVFNALKIKSDIVALQPISSLSHLYFISILSLVYLVLCKQCKQSLKVWIIYEKYAIIGISYTRTYRAYCFPFPWLDYSFYFWNSKCTSGRGRERTCWEFRYV